MNKKDFLRWIADLTAENLSTVPKKGWMKKADELHGKRYDYSESIYTGGDDRVGMLCPVHGKFRQRVSFHLSGVGCKACHVESRVKTAKDFVLAAYSVHGDRYDYSRVEYRNNKKRVKVVCKKHGVFRVKPSSHVVHAVGCRKCKESKGEVAVGRYLDELGIAYVPEFKLPDYLYRYDFCLTNLNILIEFHGAQHYRPVRRFGGAKGLTATRIRDAGKIVLAKAHKYHLVVIPHTAMDKGQLEAVLNVQLTDVYPYWVRYKGKIMTFKKVSDVYTAFKLPPKTPVLELNSTLTKLGCEVLLSK